MSSSESEALSAIIVGSPKNAEKPITLDGNTKLCSSCRQDKAISHFIGSSTRSKGQEMRTCADCRIKNTRVPVRRYKPRMPKTKIFIPEESEKGRAGRVARRQTTSSTISSVGAAENKNTAVTAQQETATYTIPPKPQGFRKSLAVAAPAPNPVTISLLGSDPEQNDNTDTDEEYYQPPSASTRRSLKRRSTPPHSASEDMDHEEAILVQQPPSKRQRTNVASTLQREVALEPEVDVDDGLEDNEPALNANGRPVGSDLAAFAASLGRLSQLLVSAGKNLDSERIGALESEIHHDWRVDEMATFVEGFLKGASANAVGKGW